jgi:hypothetical protein
VKKAMTRYLSESLQAPEPFFRLGLKRLEAANGNPSTDIRFSSEVKQATRAKLHQLGLDPDNTTAEELYHVLQQRVEADDRRLTKTLRTRAATHVSAEADVVAGMIHSLRSLPDSRHCFALKNSALKAIIKKLPPKKAMKQLGYRSLDSCLKHESPVSILAAAWLVEGHAWQQKLLDLYKRLQPGDFENRSIQLMELTSAKWHSLAAQIVTDRRHNLMSFKELGTLVFLPLPADIPPGTVTASLSLALHELNEIRASSTFLKLSIVRRDFGAVVQIVATDEPRLSSQLLDQPVPWHLIQRYYARLTGSAAQSALEPHLELSDMVWHPIEDALSAIEPSLKFWQEGAHLGLLQEGKAVSLNIVDAALNCCNQLSFEKRVVQHFQRSLWHELLLRYLQHQTVEQTVINELQPRLATETAIA